MAYILRQKVVVPMLQNVRNSSGKSAESLQKTHTLMRTLSFTAVPMAVGLAAVNAYMLEQKHKSHHRKEYAPYAHLTIRTKAFPWGDGNHSLFHNKKTQWTPGVGYEEDWYC
uniref:Cytochrome c oxidase subunit n=1 Tax=Phallusia mammillata TaxID=59560 RepID=A0A6F9DAG3_9ASCI|nr:cytochrome c oxidase subunit 6A, mitochondrial [Phallusia mammillata]